MGVVRFFHFIFFFALLFLPSESSSQSILGSTDGLVLMGGRRILGFKEVPDSEGKEDENEESDSSSLPVKKKNQDKEVSDSSPIVYKKKKEKEAPDSSSVLEKKAPKEALGSVLKKTKEAPDSSSVLEKKVPKEVLGSVSVLKKTKEALDSGSVSEKKGKLEQPIIKQVVKVQKPTNGSTTTSSSATLLKKKTSLNHTDTPSKLAPPTGLKSIKKPADLLKTAEFKNKTKVEKKTLGDASDAGESQIIKKKLDASISTSTSSATPTKKKAPATPEKKTDPKEKETQIKQKKPKEVYSDDEDDLMQDFRALPSKLQKDLIPDFAKISITSKAYLSRANREIVEGFKPLVGHKYAPFVATVTSYVFLLLPLLLVSLLFHQIREYLSLQRLLFFIHGYLGAYFTVLTLAFAFTGVEPLRFFYQYSMTSYIYMQVMQTLFYVMYLLMLVLYMVVQFSTATGLWVRVSALVQTLVGAVVGLHYYSVVFHNALARKPPKASWKSHAVYAFCFLMLSLLAKRVIDRSKKAYYHESGEGDKQN